MQQEALKKQEEQKKATVCRLSTGKSRRVDESLARLKARASNHETQAEPDSTAHRPFRLHCFLSGQTPQDLDVLSL